MGAIKSLFAPDIKPTPVPATPSAANSAEDIAAAQQKTAEQLRKQRGRAATILSNTGDDGALSGGGVATKRLLGG